MGGCVGALTYLLAVAEEKAGKVNQHARTGVVFSFLLFLLFLLLLLLLFLWRGGAGCGEELA